MALIQIECWINNNVILNHSFLRNEATKLSFILYLKIKPSLYWTLSTIKQFLLSLLMERKTMEAWARIQSLKIRVTLEYLPTHYVNTAYLLVTSSLSMLSLMQFWSGKALIWIFLNLRNRVDCIGRHLIWMGFLYKAVLCYQLTRLWQSWSW